MSNPLEIKIYSQFVGDKVISLSISRLVLFNVAQNALYYPRLLLRFTMQVFIAVYVTKRKRTFQHQFYTAEGYKLGVGSFLCTILKQRIQFHTQSTTDGAVPTYQ